MTTFELNPNCSEFVCRLKTDGVSKRKIKRITDLLDKIQAGELKPEEVIWLPEDKRNDNAIPSSDIYHGSKTIFGIDTIEISGTDGDHGEWCGNMLDYFRVDWEYGGE